MSKLINIKTNHIHVNRTIKTYTHKNPLISRFTAKTLIHKIRFILVMSEMNKLWLRSGLVVPVVASRLLGKSGAMLILIIVLMAVTSTGSAEIMAVTSILIYDIYGVYLRVSR